MNELPFHSIGAGRCDLKIATPYSSSRAGKDEERNKDRAE
jgi:hypothetical protein